MSNLTAGASANIFAALVGTEDNATYYPQDGGESVSCRMHLSQRNRSSTQYSEIDVSGIEAHLLEEEVGSRVLQGDRIKYNDKVYYVADQPTGDGYLWTVFLAVGIATT